MLKNIGIIVNSNKYQADLFSLYLIQYFAKCQISTWLENDDNDDHVGSDLIIILGGDGTVLRAFQKYGHLQVPFLCVNFGTVGFLSAVEANDVYNYLTKIVEGSYVVEERSVIQVTVIRKDKEIERAYALNDLVIRSNQLRMSYQLLKIDGQNICKCEGDGIIIATPTGATGYALSAGGAIVEPVLENILIQTLCSRKRSSNPLILGMDHIIEIVCKDKEPFTSFFIDGREYTLLHNNDLIRITGADIKARFIVLDNNRYFGLISKRYE